MFKLPKGKRTQAKPHRAVYVVEGKHIDLVNIAARLDITTRAARSRIKRAAKPLTWKGLAPDESA